MHKIQYPAHETHRGIKQQRTENAWQKCLSSEKKEANQSSQTFTVCGTFKNTIIFCFILDNSKEDVFRGRERGHNTGAWPCGVLSVITECLYIIWRTVMV